MSAQCVFLFSPSTTCTAKRNGCEIFLGKTSLRFLSFSNTHGLYNYLRMETSKILKFGLSADLILWGTPFILKYARDILASPQTLRCASGVGKLFFVWLSFNISGLPRFGCIFLEQYNHLIKQRFSKDLWNQQIKGFFPVSALYASTCPRTVLPMANYGSRSCAKKLKTRRFFSSNMFDMTFPFQSVEGVALSALQNVLAFLQKTQLFANILKAEGWASLPSESWKTASTSTVHNDPDLWPWLIIFSSQMIYLEQGSVSAWVCVRAWFSCVQFEGWENLKYADLHHVNNSHSSPFTPRSHEKHCADWCLRRQTWSLCPHVHCDWIWTVVTKKASCCFLLLLRQRYSLSQHTSEQKKNNKRFGPKGQCTSLPPAIALRHSEQGGRHVSRGWHFPWEGWHISGGWHFHGGFDFAPYLVDG